VNLKGLLSLLCQVSIMKKQVLLISVFVTVVLLGISGAQEESTNRSRIREFLVQRFDKNGDGRLSAEERKELRRFLESRRNERGATGDQARGVGRMEVPEPSKLVDLYGQDEPEQPITFKELELTDSERDKVLPFRATYPRDSSGRLPVIVWSHGLFGSQDYYRPLVDHWAEHGYLVLQPSHSDSRSRGSGLTNPTSEWYTRPQDISFLLDSLAAHPLLGEKADMTRVGMGGHSYGAHTTMLVNGADARIMGPFRDPRPVAFVAISPQGEGRLLTASSWAGLKRPTLFISGDKDEGVMSPKPASWRMDPYKGSTPGEKYLLWMKDAHHNFGGIAGVEHARSGPPDGDQVALVRSATLAFWDKYLKKDPDATRLVNSGAYNKAARGLAKWSER
jgi:dienelactone hydrolase